MSIVNPRETFDRSCQNLIEELLLLGSMVELAIRNSVDALIHHDIEASKIIYTNDIKINQKRYQIEANTLTLIATQQPMARDLRFLAAILEIITELERIGDYAKGISRVNIMLSDNIIDPPYQDFSKMRDKGLDMLHRSLSAFINRDVETARAIPLEDEEIDVIYNKIYDRLIQRVIDDPLFVNTANHLTWIGHNLERMADRVTNICERIVFVVTGEVRELDQSDDELKFKL